MGLHNGTWLSLLKLSHKRSSRRMLATMPYRGVTYGTAQIPSKHFTGLISHYCLIHRQGSASEPPILYPDTHIGLIFRSQAQSLSDAFIVGPSTKPSVCDYVIENTEYFSVMFSLVGRLALFPFEPNEFTDQIVPLNTVFPKWADTLAEHVNSKQSFNAKIEVFETFLKQHLSDARFQQKRDISYLSDIALNADYGNFIKYLKSLNYTNRHIRRFMLKYTGVTPKKLFQLMRCQSALKIMTANPQTNLSDIAYNLNYCDQTHFINEFKTIYKTTPKKFIQDFLG